MLLLASASALCRKAPARRIAGAVSDLSSAAIPMAKVTVTDVQRNDSRILTTDSSGSYAAPDLIPGTYTVHVEYHGFKNADRRDILLEVGADLRVDVGMQTGDQTETVTVTEEAAALNTSNAELGGSLSNQVINDLPLNGRNFENLLDLRPGICQSIPATPLALDAEATSGLRPHDNFFMVDGINSNDPWMAQSMSERSDGSR